MSNPQPLLKIKSIIILNKILLNLLKTRKLILIKYNKRIKKKVNINNNDYEEEFSPIEIKIIFSGNKHSQFINFDKTNEKYFHIYVDNKEYKKNEIGNEIKEVKIIIDHQIKSFFQLFLDCRCIESVIFNKFNRTNIIDMKQMFDGCLLKELNLSNFNTVNVANMSYMFNGCKSLRKINLSKFNTENVTKYELYVSWM